MPYSNNDTAYIFNGPTYEPQHDNKRLLSQYETIFNLMKDGKWRTLQEIEDITGYPQASISAQLRHAKKLRFGGHTVEKQSRGERSRGLFEYKLIVNVKPAFTPLQFNQPLIQPQLF